MLLAEIPDLGWIAVIGVVIVILGAIGLALILRMVRELRANLAEELRRELVAQREPAPVAVQSPLEVTQHPGVATQTELQTVKTELHGRLKREREEINAEIRRVETATKERSDLLSADLKTNTALTQAMSGEVRQINQNVHLILTSLTQRQ